MADWEYRSVPVTIYRSGEFHLQDLESHKQVLTNAGWEYIDMRALPTKDPQIAEIILRFRRRKTAEEKAKPAEG